MIIIILVLFALDDLILPNFRNHPPRLALGFIGIITVLGSSIALMNIMIVSVARTNNEK
jgi:hypothetical protein